MAAQRDRQDSRGWADRDDDRGWGGRDDTRERL
jgi:hypothetical protein